MPGVGVSHPRGKSASQIETSICEDGSNDLAALVQDEQFEDAPINQGLLSGKRKSIRNSRHYRESSDCSKEWMRPYWLGSSLFLLLFAFWILDSLKDPLFARLVEGNIDRHQPSAKLCSVASTLILVCLLEYLASRRQRHIDEELSKVLPSEEILDPMGNWKSMPVRNQGEQHHPVPDDTISISIFYHIGVPYAFAFGLIAILVQRFDEVEHKIEKGFDVWYILAYFLYATVESFGSILVATFWSFTNSTLSLDDAERYYGQIIALAQLGAILGSTLVAADFWRVPSLLVVVSLVIILQMLVMRTYDTVFKPTSMLAIHVNETEDDEGSTWTWQDNDATLTKPFWSGLYLIFNHSYVVLILGVSCLYEVALTCLDYQMKLLGYSRFEVDNEAVTMSFSEFMGRYGQVVNFFSLLLSSIVFPRLIRQLGLRITLRIFPSLLLLATMVAYGALPGNLSALFVSLSILKAMTYSIHDPSKEILYIPTSNAVKFRAKFWIDVVGERISKAIGSGFNKFSGSIERSVRIGGLPSIVSAAGLWFACYYAGLEFDRLIHTGKIVGLDTAVNTDTYRKVLNHDKLSEVEISFPKASGMSAKSKNLHNVSTDDARKVHNETALVMRL